MLGMLIHVKQSAPTCQLESRLSLRWQGSGQLVKLPEPGYNSIGSHSHMRSHFIKSCEFLGILVFQTLHWTFKNVSYWKLVLVTYITEYVSSSWSPNVCQLTGECKVSVDWFAWTAEIKLFTTKKPKCDYEHNCSSNSELVAQQRFLIDFFSPFRS